MADTTADAYLEAQALQKELQEEYAKRPKWREEPIQGMVNLTIEPTFVPRRFADMDRLRNELSRMFQLTFDASEVRRFEQQAGTRINLLDYMRDAVTEDKRLRFLDGMIEVRELGRKTPIPEVIISRESISSNVIGSSTEALHVAKEAAVSCHGFQADAQSSVLCEG